MGLGIKSRHIRYGCGQCQSDPELVVLASDESSVSAATLIKKTLAIILRSRNWCTW